MTIDLSDVSVTGTTFTDQADVKAAVSAVVLLLATVRMPARAR